MAQYLLMDIGGTFVKYALSDENGTFQEHGKIETNLSGRDEFIASLKPLFSKYRGKVDACAVSMPGVIDTRTGFAHTAGALSLFMSGVPVAQLFEEQIGCPVTIANDGKCAAAAEAWLGTLSDVENGMVVVVGTGIAGGIVINHKVYLGSRFSAGEWSTVLSRAEMEKGGYRIQSFDNILAMTERGPWWFSYASASTLMTDYKLAAGMDVNTVVRGEEFFELVRQGDETANAVLKNWARELAVGIYSVQSVLDVERIAVGGGISGAPELMPAIEEALDEIFAVSMMLPVNRPELVKCKFGNDANLIGALKMHFDYNS